jgi:hypothetical protein
MITLEESEKFVEHFVGEVPRLWGWEETGIEVSVSACPGMQ